MKTIALDLEALLAAYLPQLHRLSDQNTELRPAQGKWSKKELIGHLVDSAQNNIRRFITAQYEETPLIVYDQDKWVSAQRYQEYEWKDLVQLWYLLNGQVVILIRNMPEVAARRTCQTQELHTLEWLAADYIKHLQHHLHQVLDMEPVAYP